MDRHAFDGVRVVELAQWVFVPVAGALLADWGADVIHIEPPRGRPVPRPDHARGSAPAARRRQPLDGAGQPRQAVDRHRRAQRTRVGRCCIGCSSRADVFLTNLRPGALERLGLDDETRTGALPAARLRARPWVRRTRAGRRHAAGYDASAFWARGGLAHILTPPDLDYPIGQRGAMGDRNGAMALAFGISAALLRRERTGAGGVVDVSLLATAMWTLSSDLLSALDGADPQASAGRGFTPNPLVLVYRTKDDRHIRSCSWRRTGTGAVLRRASTARTCVDDPRFVDLARRKANSAALIAELDAEFASRTFEEWKELLAGLDAPWAPVQAVERAARRPAGDGQRLRRRGRERQRRRRTDCRPSRCSSTGRPAELRPGAGARRAHRDSS